MSATAMKKTVKANINNPVFSYVDKGVYSAQLFGYEVLATRVAHNVWGLRVTAGVDTGKLKEFLTTEQKLRIKQFYKVRKDKLRGGFSLIMFDSKGIVEKVEGPFETAGETYERIMKLEGVEFPGE